MGAFFDSIPDNQIDWILAQKVFWVATAPLSGAGHVNVSPKGGPYFGIVDRHTFWYLELTGSGSETIAHLYEPGNGRITVQFNAFDGPPKILRLYGHGRVLERGDDAGELTSTKGSEFSEFVSHHNIDVLPGTRSVIVVDIQQAGTSCGFSVPLYDFREHRSVLIDHHKKKEEQAKLGDETKSMPWYWAQNNSWSVDGLPALKAGQDRMRKGSVPLAKKMSGLGAMKQYRLTGSEAGAFTTRHLILTAVISALLTALLILYGARLADGLDRFSVQDVRKVITSPLATLI